MESVGVCQTCHGPIESFEDIQAKADFDEDGTIEATTHEIEGLLHKLDTLLPSRASNSVITQNFNWTTAGLSAAEVERRRLLSKAWYNLLFVEEDGSHGVHNAGYSINLLRRSIASITTGDIGATEIISITDIPNDQGKQVRLAWDGFPGDGVSTDPISNYSLWRRVDDVAGKVSQELPNKEALYASATRGNVGKRFKVAQVSGWWDFVDVIPASSQDVYSIVAPTLYDSTVAGAHWTVFYVAGHRRSGQTVETAPDSGYSVDNLAPSAPSSVVASGAGASVSLSWDDPVDADFKYFAIYRSTTSGFDPRVMSPLATITGTEYGDNAVVVGTRYYYRVSTYDFAGNQSAFSLEFSALVTSIDEGSAVPTEFALQQNYPNPFNPETKIEYQLATPEHVRLSIYTVLGQEVRRLVDRSQTAAYHTVVWDGRDNAGTLMPSGLYFYRIESGAFTVMKKMLLMK